MCVHMPTAQDHRSQHCLGKAPAISHRPPRTVHRGQPGRRVSLVLYRCCTCGDKVGGVGLSSVQYFYLEKTEPSAVGRNHTEPTCLHPICCWRRPAAPGRRHSTGPALVLWDRSTSPPRAPAAPGLCSKPVPCLCRECCAAGDLGPAVLTVVLWRPRWAALSCCDPLSRSPTGGSPEVSSGLLVIRLPSAFL